MREQLGDGGTVGGGARQVAPQRVGEVEQALVPQPQYEHGDEGLGDRADPVLDVGGRRVTVDHAAGAAPDQSPVPEHTGDHRGGAALGLGDGQAVQQRAAGGGEQFVGQVGHLVLCDGFG